MAIASTDGRHLEARRFDLTVEHQGEIQQLQSAYVQLRRHSLAVVVASTFAAGVCASLLLPWFYNLAGSDLALTMPLVAAVIGAAAGASIWIERFGRAAP
jgi:TolB-like protein